MRALPFTLVLGLLFASCGAGSSAPGSAAPPESIGLTAQTVPDRPFLQRMARAPENTRFEGLRRVGFSFDLFGSMREFECTERVYADGSGSFAIDPVEILTPTLSDEEEQLFRALQKEREAFFFRYRDFRIHELPLFLANYEVAEIEGASQTIVGRRCVRLEVRRIGAADRHYEVDVDPETGLVLRYREYDPNLQVTAEMAFSELTFAPDLAGVDLRADAFEHVELDLQQDPAEVLGFDPLVPAWLPPGYQLRETLRQSLLVDGATQHWARYVYTDGLEKLFMLHREEPEAPPAGANPVSTDPLHRPSGGPDRVRTFSFGPWTVADGSVGAYRVVIVGKVVSDDLFLMLQSALD